MLNHISIFKNLPPEVIAALEQQTLKRHFAKNMILCSEGESSDSLYLIESGKVKVFVTGVDGRQVTLNFQGKGEFFGELALIDGKPRSASVMTVEASVCRLLPRSNFQHFLKQHPAIVDDLMINLVWRIRYLTENIRDLALLDVYGRVAHLLKKIDQNKLANWQNLTHQEIANIVGASREMVGRIMRELCVGGYVEQTSKGPVIRKPLPKGW